MLVLGFDFGMKFIGVATGQAITKTATPVTSLRAVDGIPDWEEVARLIEKWRPSALLVGSPLNMDGSNQLMTHCANKFANRLRQKYKLPVHLVDERLSTWQAKQNSALGSSFNELVELNAAAAAIIVEQWLNSELPN